MKTFKRLGISITLIGVLSMTVLAGSTNSPPCGSPDPGSTNSPPCAMSQITQDDPETATGTDTAAATAELSYSVNELAIDLLRSILPLF